MTAPERIFITGIGSISPLGKNTGEMWHALVNHDSRPHLRQDQGFDLGAMKNRLCYPVSRQDGSWPQQSTTTAFALAAAREALASAKIDNLADMTIGVGVGTGAGDSDVAESFRTERGPNEPITDRDIPYGVAERIAQALHCEGPAFNLSNACSASLYACAYAAELLQAGCADAILVIGAESVGRVTQAAMERMGALDTEYCRPFDALRSGTMLGEGAAALLLEPADGS